MRFRIRSCALAALLAAFAIPLHAQSARPFENSWFWGLKAGSLRISSNAESGRTIGTFGGDWLITRQSGGLYVSFDMANFTSESRVEDSNSGGGFRQLQVNDLRRVGVAGMIFPVKYGVVRPYGGIGMSLELLGDASVLVDSSAVSSDAPDQAFFGTVDERRSQIGLMFLGGAQAEFSRLAAFLQASVVPASGRFLIGRDPLFAMQVGVRYNIGTSIER